MLGFGRAAVPRRATFQPSDQIVIQIADMQIAGHLTLPGIIDINDPTLDQVGQDACLCDLTKDFALDLQKTGFDGSCSAQPP